MCAIKGLRQGVPERVSIWNRNRKWKLLQSRLQPGSETTVLDVGFTASEGRRDDNYLEKHYLHLHNVTALTIDDPGNSAERYPGLTVVQYDGLKMPFRDSQFDIVWSNAVLEHVGARDRQIEFLRELDRVGRDHFVTTPNRWFLFEVHTRVFLMHWLPPALFFKYLRRRGMSWAADDYMWLLSRRQYRERLDQAGVFKAKVKANRILFPAIDFVAIWTK